LAEKAAHDNKMGATHKRAPMRSADIIKAPLAEMPASDPNKMACKSARCDNGNTQIALAQQRLNRPV
jgi:hypothetical protein